MKRRSVVSALAVAMMSSAASAAPIYIDFNTGGSRPTNFNRISPGGSITDAMDINGSVTTIDVALPTNGARTGNTGGVSSPSGDAAVFGAALSDYVYGQTTGLEAGNFNITFSGLTPGGAYDFIGSAARTNATPGVNYNAIYDFRVNNTVVATTTFNPLNNTSEVFSVDNVMASDTGQITLRVRAGSGNSNFFLLSALSIEAVPEPGAAAVLAGGALTLLARRRR